MPKWNQMKKALPKLALCTQISLFPYHDVTPRQQPAQPNWFGEQNKLQSHICSKFENDHNLALEKRIQRKRWRTLLIINKLTRVSIMTTTINQGHLGLSFQQSHKPYHDADLNLPHPRKLTSLFSGPNSTFSGQIC